MCISVLLGFLTKTFIFSEYSLSVLLSLCKTSQSYSAEACIVLASHSSFQCVKSKHWLLGPSYRSQLRPHKTSLCIYKKGLFMYMFQVVVQWQYWIKSFLSINYQPEVCPLLFMVVVVEMNLCFDMLCSLAEIMPK